jgi:hypothetical protein
MPADHISGRFGFLLNRLSRRAMPLASAAALSLVVSTAAHADLCFRYTKSGGGTVVARGAKVPAPNTCITLALYEVDGRYGKGLQGAATGSLCTDWAGATMIYHYTYDGCLGPNRYFESATCRLQLRDGNVPTTFGGCRGTVNNTGFTDDSLVAEFCNGEDVALRVPNDLPALCVIKPGLNRKLDEVPPGVTDLPAQQPATR